MLTVAIEVINARLVENTRKSYTLPLRIGRGADCDIQLDPENRAISRVHIELVEEDGHVVLINRASNPKATVIDSRSLASQERVVLGPDAEFRIFDTELRLVSPMRLGLAISGARDARPALQEALAPERSLVAVESDDGRLEVEGVADLAHYDRSRFAGRLALAFYYDGGQPSLAVVSNPNNETLLLDRAEVDQPALYLQPLDTIEIGKHRIEVLKPGEPSIVCENPDCRVLNHYDRGDNCRLCGSRLFGETRMMRLRSV